MIFELCFWARSMAWSSDGIFFLDNDLTIGV
jgi:hypothetical protein